MTENLSGNAKYDFRNSNFQGPVFIESVFHEAIGLTQGLGAQPPQRAELAEALEALCAQLATLPAGEGAVVAKAAEGAKTAKQVVEATKVGGIEALFCSAVRSLRDWAEDIGETVPAISTATEQVIKLAGQIRGWIA